MSEFLNPIYILSILIALSVHEAAHGFVAYRLGDPTAKYAGRLTLNPLAHLDPLGTLLFVTVGFGWGKPVPVDPRYFKNHKRGTALVSLAGPLSNLILAIVSYGGLLLVAPHVAAVSPYALLGVTGSGSVALRFLAQFFGTSLFLNLGLMAFNLLPIAPLDGSKILQAFIPYRYEPQYDAFMRQGPYILLILLIAGRFSGIDVLSAWVMWWIGMVLKVLGM